MAERVLPFLARRTSDCDGKESEESQPLAAQITEVSSTISYVNKFLVMFSVDDFINKA